jgi:hypothetical protein
MIEAEFGQNRNKNEHKTSIFLSFCSSGMQTGGNGKNVWLRQLFVNVCLWCALLFVLLNDDVRETTIGYSGKTGFRDVKRDGKCFFDEKSYKNHVSSI